MNTTTRTPTQDDLNMTDDLCTYTVKTSELTGAALDWAVAKCENVPNIHIVQKPGKTCVYGQIIEIDFPYQPSTDWSQGGPIIEREGIEIVKGNPLYFPKGNENGDFYEPLWIAGKQHGQTHLIAAMRCFVASRLGDTVELVETL